MSIDLALLEQVREAPVDERVERVRNLLAPVREERDALVAERERAVAHIATLDGDIAYYDKVLRAAEPAKPAAKRKKAAPTPTTASPRVAAAVRWVVLQPAPVDAKDVSEALGIPHAKAGDQLRIARSLELLRDAGTRPNPQGRDSKLYAGFADSLERLERLSGQ